MFFITVLDDESFLSDGESWITTTKKKNTQTLKHKVIPIQSLTELKFEGTSIFWQTYKENALA